MLGLVESSDHRENCSRDSEGSRIELVGVSGLRRIQGLIGRGTWVDAVTPSPSIHLFSDAYYDTTVERLHPANNPPLFAVDRCSRRLQPSNDHLVLTFR